MSTTALQTDYLIVGAGAMGMAFADVLVNETNASVVIVDKQHQPGGHWNNAYPFVRLHQPSAFYGVNSRQLGNDTLDSIGWNKGLYELATNSEVCAYFDAVMQQQFLPSGRVQYFPMCEYKGEGRFQSLVSPARYEVRAKKVVDATYMDVAVPSMVPPGYEVADGVDCVPPNSLTKLLGQHTDYVVVGAGKTGMDACLFLLKNSVAPDHITWIMPRDAWMLNRANIQPGKLFADVINKGFARQMQIFAQAKTVEEVFAGCEESGQLLRLDSQIKPTMYRCATVTELELEQLRGLTQIVRKGRVKALERGRIQLEHDTLDVPQGALHIDCTADGLARRPALPVFDGEAIRLQSVRTCQQVFSAAFIAHVEASYTDEQIKNELCTVVPHPDSAADFLRTALANGLNGARWGQEAELQAWLAQSRLDGFSQNGVSADEMPTSEELRAMMVTAGKALSNLQSFVQQLDAET